MLSWAVLLAGAVLLQAIPLASPQPGSDWTELQSLAGLGVAPAVVGGLRAPAADLLWLRANRSWEQRDPAATDAYLRATVALAPEFDYFRVNAARMIAFDFPEWERAGDEPAEVSRRRRLAYGERALALLERRPGSSAAVLIERARLTHQIQGDRSRAAALYREAAELPAAPYFAGRLAVELLVQEGQIDGARTWLRHWLGRLPADDPDAQRARMAARLADLDARAGR